MPSAEDNAIKTVLRLRFLVKNTLANAIPKIAAPVKNIAKMYT